MMSALPDKQFFKIGEAAEIIGVKTHVLRYWETEFPGIRPLKTRGAHRMYRRADVEMLGVIHRLLHQEGYTIAGARKRVRELRGEQELEPAVVSEASRELSLRAELIQVRNELASLLETLNAADEQPTARAHEMSATVTSVVPKTVLIPQRKLQR
jgi:DNA-binding transcriptional MerR regulator